MNRQEIWNKFLDKLKEKVDSILVDTWFNNEDTSLYSFEDNHAIIMVKLPFMQNHLETNYGELIDETFSEVVEKIVTHEFISEKQMQELEAERKHKIVDIDSDFVKQTPVNAGLDPKNTFQNFITGDSNKFAYKVALAVAESPGMYNPLFLYGESGVGKTHLMQAIGNYLIEKTDKKVLYITSDNFVNDYIKLFRNNDKNNFDKIDDFKDKYRNVDVLMIDDIQFLGNAQKGQEEFFHTFNELQAANKQIIIASDRPVDDLNSIENRLITRFSGGLNAGISTPDYDLRIGIIKSKLAYQEAVKDLPEDVIEYIANNFDSDIRKLTGAITRVCAYASMFYQGKVSLDIAIDALKDMLKDRSYYKNDIQRIQRVVCDYYKISIDQMKGKKKNSEVNFPRQVAIYLCRELTTESFPKIGSYFGGRNHSTIISAYQRIQKELVTNEKLKSVIKDLKNNLT